MRPAPPLTLQCSPSRAWLWACTLVGALAGLAFAGWVAGHLEWSSPARGAAWLCAATGGALLGRVVAGPPIPAQVRWDGLCWWVDGVGGVLSARIDLGRWLLLLQHCPSDGSSARWLAVSVGGAADDLRLLRTALYSPPPDAPPGPLHVRAADRATD